MLVLASASPRRREILRALGIDFRVVEPQVEELTEGEPEEVVLENARRKARAGAKMAEAGALVLGADTEVVLEGWVLGKPASEADARDRLRALSGRTHVVLSGVVILGPVDRGTDPPERSGVARSEVTFKPLDEATAELYLASGEWRDRAGGYAVQGLGSILIDRLAGDLSNVVGLPVPLILQLAPELAPQVGKP